MSWSLNPLTYIARPSWRKRADEAAAARDKGIPAEWRLPENEPLPVDSTGLIESSGILSDTELEIVSCPATVLAQHIARGEYTAEAVTLAFCKSAAIAQQATNCLLELFVPEALERARELDKHYKTTGEVLGPLHGVPVSIKDHIDIKGHDSPSGFLSLVGKMVAKEDAYSVRVLRDAGAVFYCKTMLPQSIMHLETSNYLGTTVCPRNRALTAGGSSGGEGALIGMRGSPLGVGTDIGGSVRSPAAAGGIFSFKPSVGRVPYLGCQEPGGPPGWEGILGTHGPLAADSEDLELYMRIMVGSEPWKTDPSCHVRPWRPPSARSQPLRIGVLRDDGVVLPVAPIRRALAYTIEKLEKAGNVQFVEFTPYKSAEAWSLISKLYWAEDGGAGVYQCCKDSGEPVLPLTKWIIDQSGYNCKAPPASELLSLTARRDEFRYEFARHWQEHDIDVLLSPVGPSPAPPLEYTSYWNLVNYPAAVFPTGLFVETSDTDEKREFRNDSEKHVWNNYSTETSIGAPLCLQLIGYVGYDEETLDALKTVIAAVRA